MAAALAVILAAAFGAGDQYLGSRVLQPWGPALASLSAPWLLLAFAGGCTQRTPRRAAVLGLGCTFAALLGYFTLTDSPVEGAHYTLANARGFFISNAATVGGGVFTGPLLGWLGYRWHSRRAVLGALIAAGSLCFEPLAHRAPLRAMQFRGRGYVLVNPIGSPYIVISEIAAGLLLALYFAAGVLRARSAQP
jgi:hypothetical protein